MSSFVHKVHEMSQPLLFAFTSVNCIVFEMASFQIRLQSLGMEILTGQFTGKPVKVDNLPVYRWSSKSLQFPALPSMSFQSNFSSVNKHIKHIFFETNGYFLCGFQCILI